MQHHISICTIIWGHLTKYSSNLWPETAYGMQISI